MLFWLLLLFELVYHVDLWFVVQDQDFQGVDDLSLDVLLSHYLVLFLVVSDSLFDLANIAFLICHDVQTFNAFLIVCFKHRLFRYVFEN